MMEEIKIRPPVAIRDLKKEFRWWWEKRGKIAVDGISMTIGPGTVFVLLGPNGSGKSTLMKLLAGLLTPTSGTAEIFGCPPRSRESRRRLGYLPEDNLLYPFLTGRENLDMIGRLHGMGRADRQRKIWQLLSTLDLSRDKEVMTGNYSKGMAKRLGIAASLMHAPSLLLWDEPWDGLDPFGLEVVKNLMSDAVRNGATILVSTHLLYDVVGICNEIGLLYQGCLIAAGKLDELLRTPNRFTIDTDAPRALVEDWLEELRRKSPGCSATVVEARKDLKDCFIEMIRNRPPPEQEKP